MVNFPITVTMGIREFGQFQTAMTRGERLFKGLGEAAIEQAKRTVTASTANYRMVESQRALVYSQAQLLEKQAKVVAAKNAERAAIMRTQAEMKRYHADSQLMVAGYQRQRAEGQLLAAQHTQIVEGMLFAGVSAALLGTALAALNKDMKDSALAAERIAVAYNVVARASDTASEALAEESAQLQALDMTAAQSQDLLSNLLKAQVDVTQADKLRLAVLNLAVLANKDYATAQEAATRATVNATTRGLQAIDAGEEADRIFAQYAASIGKTSQQLTKAERSQAVMNYIIQEGTKAAGAYTALLRTTAGQAARFRTNIEQLKVEIGQGLLPATKLLLTDLNLLLEGFAQLPPEMKASIGAASELSATLLTLGGAVGIGYPLIKNLGAAWQFFSKQLGVVVTANAAKSVATLGAAVKGLGTLTAATVGQVAGLVAVGVLLYQIVKETDQFLQREIALYERLAQARGPLMGNLWDLRFMGLNTSALNRVLQELGKVLGEAVYKLFTRGRQVGEALADGLADGGQAVEASSEELAQAIVSYFGENGQPSRGPLSSIEQQGYRLIQAYVKGMSDGLSTETVERLAEQIGFALTRAQWDIEDQITAVERAQRDLDDSLIPYEQRLAMVKAALVPVTIELRNQREELEDMRAVTATVWDAYVADAERALAASQEWVDLVQGRLSQLDDDLRPMENAVRLLRAENELVLIPMRQQETALQRQIDAVERLIDAERERYQMAMRATQASLEAIEDQLYALDSAIQPFVDQLTLVQAAATLVLIPLQREERLIQREIEHITKLAEIEQERVERHIEALRAQQEEIQRLIQVDRDRLDLIEHTIFIEELRNKILGRSASLQQVQLQGERDVLKDQVARREQDARAMQEQIQAEQENLQDLKRTLEEQLAPLQARLDKIQEAIQAQEDLITFAQEELSIRQAMQAEERVALENRRRELERVLELQQRQFDAWERAQEDRVQPLKDQLRLLQDQMQALEDQNASAQANLDLLRAQQEPMRVFLEDTLRAAQNVVAERQKSLDLTKQQRDAALRGVDQELANLDKDIAKVEDLIQQFQDAFDLAAAARTMASLAFAEERRILDIAMDDFQIRLRDLQRANILKANDERLAEIREEASPTGEAAAEGVEEGWKKKWLEFTARVGYVDIPSFLTNLGYQIGMGSPAEKLVPYGTSMVEGIRKGWQDLWGNFVGTVEGSLTGLLRSMNLWWENNQQAFYDLGAGIPQAIARGIQDNLQALQEAAQRMQQTVTAPDYTATTTGTGVGMVPVAAGSATTYNSTTGPTINVQAHYANAQSPVGITNDIGLLLKYA